jgi:hypothetical protein
VADLVVEANELVIATHGRGFWVLDDIAALRQATPAVLASDAHLFAPPVGVRSGPGVAVSWWLAKTPKALRLEIVDSAGAVLRTFEPDTAKPDTTKADSAASAAARRNRGVMLPMTAGINRIIWDLRAQGITPFPKMILWGAGTNGPAVPPGRYTVRLVADGRTTTAPVTVTRNPWLDATDADLRAQYAFSRRVRDRANDANQAVIEIRRVKSQLDDRLTRSKDSVLAARGATLRTNASAVEERIYQVRNQSGQDPLNFPIKVNNRLATLLAMVERGDARPTNNMPEIFGILSTELGGYTARLAQVWSTDLAATNAELARLGLPLLDPACVQVKGCAPRP